MVDRYLQHVLWFGEKHNILIGIMYGLDRNKAGAGPMQDQRAIIVAPIVDDETYAIALHELGHHLAPQGNLNHLISPFAQFTNFMFATPQDFQLRLDEEKAAWDWACQNAIEWTPAMQSCRETSFASYAKDERLRLARTCAADDFVGWPTEPSKTLPKGAPLSSLNIPRRKR